ncbi:F-box protein At5g51370-like [Magnolia sinica]|uniref:F-box protein At5g51370-like n=1 Tax=Magnolia sinica TaxID=86752 RepID=UPI002658E820|nr:F-box protein At5g51370-like [Magnolia sinica]
MPLSSENYSPRKKLKKPLSLPNIWFKDQSLKHVIFNMHLRSLNDRHHHHHHLIIPDDDPSPPSPGPTSRFDHTSLLPDSILLRILSFLPPSQYNPNSLVCRRWLLLTGRLIRTVRLLDWNFLESGRLIDRFPNVTDVDLVPACIESPYNSSVHVTHRLISLHLDADLDEDDNARHFIPDKLFLPADSVDDGLRILARGCPNLRKLVLIATEAGLASIATDCPNLQELELHRCTDLSLRAIFACQNLQILRLVGIVDGFYYSTVSDIGLTILAHGCRRLVKLELCGCEGSYDGISAIGKCCLMLEELTLYDHRMDSGWIAALSFCHNLKTLRLLGCKRIDPKPGAVEHLGSCPTLERLHVQRCHLRDKDSVNALFVVCGAVREIEFQDCWGLDDEMFGIATICRRVKLLSLEGCSLLTADGLESVVLSWKELQRLRIVSCNNIRDSEVTPALSNLLSVLKEFKWRPDSRSVLASSLAGTGMGNKGGRFFNWA